MRSESSSSLNSSISGPGSSVFSSPSSAASTAATTVVDDDDYDVIQNLYIRRDASMEPSIRAAYESILVPLINQELVHSAYAERYSIALCSVGFQTSAFAPAILISTRTPKAKKKIFAHLARLEDLGLALKEHNLALHVVVHRFRTAGGETASLGDVGMLAYAVPRVDSNALCGSRIVIPKLDRGELSCCTSGLTFNVGGRACGKTALHPWEDIDDAVSEVDSESSGSDEEDDETDDGLALSLVPDNPGFSDESDDSSALFMHCGRDGFIHFPQTRQLANNATETPQIVQASVKSTRCGPNRVLPLYHGPQTDWVLYDAQSAAPEIPLSDLVRNEVAGHQITKFHHEDPDARVAVAVADHEAVVHGVIQPGSVCLRYGSRTYDLRRVTLERPLRSGCSGAAVAHRDELCGTILAVSEEVPWAYMVPIEAELKEMEAVCGLPVRLSGAQEAQLVELGSLELTVSTRPRGIATVPSSNTRPPETFEVILEGQINHNLGAFLPRFSYEARPRGGVAVDLDFEIEKDFGSIIYSEPSWLSEADGALGMLQATIADVEGRYMGVLQSAASIGQSPSWAVFPFSGSSRMGTVFQDFTKSLLLTGPQTSEMQPPSKPSLSTEPIQPSRESSGWDQDRRDCEEGPWTCRWRPFATSTICSDDSITAASLDTSTVTTPSASTHSARKAESFSRCPHHHLLSAFVSLAQTLRMIQLLSPSSSQYEDSHRDIKPANILVAEEVVKLADIGPSHFRRQVDRCKSTDYSCEGTASTSSFAARSSARLFHDKELHDIFPPWIDNDSDDCVLGMLPDCPWERFFIGCEMCRCRWSEPPWRSILQRLLAASVKFKGHEASRMQKGRRRDDKVFAWLQGVEDGVCPKDADDESCVA
ncbi:uncharacterized protein PV07_02542 [Cladophialophora immunda]|uniref:Protein kinase domain-containing protein n=1 Tax=Cladophialophora immunda TaxID=569365 RepID=A0A0D2D590_9EURO|nr:uncharacterized protein PV07_02542 [Cladophialophora immunda]KIW30849.1 hypothetical protein PV07_02542 [Cladophialophora immunda]OQV02163.1 Protein kinase domain-containing protein [Cladophialophora immunda]